MEFHKKPYQGFIEILIFSFKRLNFIKISEISKTLII